MCIIKQGMATAEQIMSLIRSHTSEDAEHFYTVALQIASYEARRGHQNFADDIRQLFKVHELNRRKKETTKIPEGLQDILIVRSVEERLNQLVVNETTELRIKRILKEYLQQEILKRHGLHNRRKILLAGPSGTGKTMTAAVIARELHLPLIAVQLDLILSRYMGESSAKLHQVFEYISQHRALYLFDEFDTLGCERGGNDVGEMRRVLNTLLILIEQDKSESLILAATNKPEMLDKAIFRRFDDCVEYTFPNQDGIAELIRNTLATFITDDISVEALSSMYERISCADVVCACRDAVKESLLSDSDRVTQHLLERAFIERAVAAKFRE